MYPSPIGALLAMLRGVVAQERHRPLLAVATVAIGSGGGARRVHHSDPAAPTAARLEEEFERLA